MVLLIPTCMLINLLKNRIKRIKIFDWILIGFSIIAVIVFIFLFFRKSTYLTVVVSVKDDSSFYNNWWGDEGVKYWFASYFQKGQKERDGFGRSQAEVLNVYSYDRTATNKNVYLEVRLKTVYVRSTDSYTYKGSPVLVGSTIKLNLDKAYAEGIISNIEGSYNDLSKRKIIVEAQLREENSTFLGTAGTKEYVADAIKVGDVVKDSNGTTIMRILDKKISPAETTITTNIGQVLRGFDPVKKDVFLTIEIEADKVEEKYYFLYDIPILIDQPIPINTTTVSIFPVVTKFIDY